ncbi:MAG: metal ABC transporter permease [Minwuiales bacterium]|nr:metal ABC transporter permease [Minwuiales bacterium]
MSAVEILAAPFALCVLLVVSHTYLGLHVLARGIIFVDLSLAQVAALGASMAFLFGQEVHGVWAQVYAFAATLLAAFGFARLRAVADKTTREVIIGCVYVVATALAIVILSRSVSGMEELKRLLNGSILWVGWDQVAVIAVVYGALALLHAAGRRRFEALSFGEADGGPGSFLWEYLFFASFAVVITLAVHIAGVLIVFAFLIIPAFSASLIVVGWGRRLPLGWLLGVIGSAGGLAAAYLWDLPVGPTVVCALGILPVLAALGRRSIARAG